MKKLKENLKFIWSYTKTKKFKFNILLMLSVLSIMLGIIIPILSAKIIVNITNKIYEQIISIALILMLVEIIDTLFSCIQRKMSLDIYKTVSEKLNNDLIQNILQIENESLDKNGSGVFIQRLTHDANKISDIFNNFLVTIFNIIKYIGVIIAILVINPIVFIFICLCILISFIINNHRTSEYTKNDEKNRNLSEKLSRFIIEIILGSKDIKMLNTEKQFIKEYNKKLKDINNKKLIMENKNNKYLIFNSIVSSIYNFALIILLIIFLEHNLISATFAIVIYNYYQTAKEFPNEISKALEYIKDFNLSATRINKIINSKEFIKETFGTEHIDKIDGNIEFDNVEFGYTDKLVLKGTTFKINAGETVAFVGKSGAGKTTIFNLICKMYQILKGVIKLDGIDINKLDKESIRGNITIISQNPYIFNMSIKENLKVVKSDMTEEEMKNASKAACLTEFIESLPYKYDTIIGENGVNLSGGQKQRIAIARALVQNTKIILFDEATSSLDNETQEKIQKAIENMSKKYTILIIAHRLTTIKNASRILYLDKGKIIADGTHKQLMKNCAKYKKLYETELEDND